MTPLNELFEKFHNLQFNPIVGPNMLDELR